MPRRRIFLRGSCGFLVVVALSGVLFLSARPATQAAEVPPGKIEELPPEQALAILGQPVAEPDGKTVGRLVDVLIDGAGAPQAAVIDFGGFMGVGARKVVVHWSTLHFAPGDLKRPITLELTPDQVKAAPEYKNPSKPIPVVMPETPPAPRGDLPILAQPAVSR